MSHSNDGPGTPEDAKLHALAHADLAAYERDVTAADTESALAAMRARLADPNAPSFQLADVRAGSSGQEGGRRRSRWVWLGAAAAVVVLVIGGLVLVLRDGDDSTVGNVPVTPSPAQPATVPSTLLPTTLPVTTPPTSITAVPTTSATTVPSPTAPPTTLPPTTLPPTTLPPTTLAPTTTPPTAVAGQGGTALAIPVHCTVEPTCTRLANTQDGRIVAYEPTDETLRVYDPTGQQLQLEVPLSEALASGMPFIEHVGPDDVVYMSHTGSGAGDYNRELLAIPLIGPRAGQIVARWAIDGSGDTDLAPTRIGLAGVGCCGALAPRPAADSSVIAYVDRNGAQIESTAPMLRLDLGDSGNTLVRVTADGTARSFTLPTVAAAPRGFPMVVPTNDGGALMLVHSQLYGRVFVVHFRPDSPERGIDNNDVVLVANDDSRGGIVLLEPAGTVVMRNADGFVRRSLDEIGTRGWPGTAVADFASGVSAPGLNEYIAANQPEWASDPKLFAVQLVPSIGPNEMVTVEFDDPTGVLTITTTGLLDDSVAAVRRTVRTTRAADGLLRIVGGTYGQQCRPDRGHQDFNSALCG